MELKIPPAAIYLSNEIRQVFGQNKETTYFDYSYIKLVWRNKKLKLCNNSKKLDQMLI